MVYTSEVFERNYQEYCDQLANVNFRKIAEIAGLQLKENDYYLKFFTDKYKINSSGIIDSEAKRPEYMTFVIISKYILLCPADATYDADADWVSFSDFKRSSHFNNVNYFSSDTERAIEKNFSGRLGDLVFASKKLNGKPLTVEMPYDLVFQIQALPRIDLLLLFNDSDDEFPASCKVLFQRHAEYYLDPESLAMTGACLAKRLIAAKNKFEKFSKKH